MKRIALLIACAGALLALPAVAETTGQTALGGPFVSGGIGEGEIARLEAQRDKHSLWVITAARRSGAYLADVQVRITDAKKAVVFDRTLDGPWLLVDLPLGRYEVEASHKGERYSRPTTIHAGDHHQMIFYFDVAADVLPKEEQKK